MARTIVEIQNQIIAQKDSEPTLAGLNSTSAVAIWRLWTYVVAVCIWTLENLFDLHKQEVIDYISTMKPHTRKWYVTKAKAFQLGYNLVADEDFYDNNSLTPQQVDASKIVKFAAAVSVVKGLTLKIAGEINGDLAPLPPANFAAFQAYMERIKDAGVRLFYINEDADRLVISLRVFYDPLIINAQGERIDQTTLSPVPDAIKAYLKSLPFNGLFLPELLEDHLKTVDGLVLPKIDTVQASFAAVPLSNVDIEYLPNAGYLRILQPSDLTIQYIAHEPI